MLILIAEDDTETARHLADGLSERDHEVVIASTGAEAIRIAQGRNFDVAVLDRLMPEGDGISVLAALREAGNQTPVLLLTALGRIEDRVDGLEAGADDYLVKPFAFEELVARVNALTRRRLASVPAVEAPVTRLTWGGLEIDLLQRRATFEAEMVLVQPRELRLLEELMRAEGRIVTKTMLLERVWNFDFDPKTNIVETHISRLRTKLGEAGARNMIDTVRCVGYRMVGQG